MMTLGAASQNADYVWIPRADAIYKLAQVERLKKDSAELGRKLAELAQVRLLNDQYSKSVIDLTRLSVIQENQIKLLQADVENWKLAARKEKRKAMLFKFAGIGVVTSATVLFLTFK